MKPDNKTGGPWLYALGLIPAVWLALLIAPSISGGLSEILEALPAAMNDPFQIVWCEDSVKTVLTDCRQSPRQMSWIFLVLKH